MTLIVLLLSGVKFKTSKALAAVIQVNNNKTSERYLQVGHSLKKEYMLADSIAIFMLRPHSPIGYDNLSRQGHGFTNKGN